MIITTQDELAGYEIKETYGLVRGSAVRARNIGRDIMASLRTIIGGEITEYSKLLGESRAQALDRMVKNAEKQGANAIVATRLVTSSIAQGTSEILAYGTAVKVEKSK